MATQNKPVLGYRPCPDCGERGTIHQAGGRRGSLYQRCGCGCDQRNGRMVQSRFWYETEWLPGLQPEAPPASVYPEAEFREKVASESGQDAGQVDRPDRADSGFQENENPGQQTDFGPELDRDRDGDRSNKPIGQKKWWLLAAAGGLVVALLRGVA